MIFEMRQLATRITPNLGNHNRKIDQTMVHRTEPANTKNNSNGNACSSFTSSSDNREGKLRSQRKRGVVLGMVGK